MSSASADLLTLKVDVLITGLRPMRALENQGNCPAPPPSTIYGMLLTLVGSERKDKNGFADLNIAVAIAENTNASLRRNQEMVRMLRKFLHVAQSRRNADLLADRRPENQELLLGLEFWLWIDDSRARHPICGDLGNVLDPARRGEIVRYGALCLGESSHLVNEVSKKPSLRARSLHGPER